PVVRALHELLDNDPVRQLDKTPCDPEETSNVHDLFDPLRERGRRFLDDQWCPQRIEEPGNPFDREVAFREKYRLRERDVLFKEVGVHVDLVATDLDGIRIVNDWNAMELCHTGCDIRDVHRVGPGPDKESVHFRDLVDIDREKKFCVMPEPFCHVPAMNQGIELLGIGEGFPVNEYSQPAHRNSW